MLTQGSVPVSLARSMMVSSGTPLSPAQVRSVGSARVAQLALVVVLVRIQSMKRSVRKPFTSL